MKYTFRTFEGFKDWYAVGIISMRHRYSKRTAHGERVRWREWKSVPLNDNKAFPTRKEAQEAGKAWVRTKEDAVRAQAVNCKS